MQLEKINLLKNKIEKILDDNKAVDIKSLNLKAEYLHSEIEKFTIVGFYVGGMKQKDLKKSESANIILGTYPMSSEGLDIPTLDAAIFSTPKSSIEQSLGRITRKEHGDYAIAFDISDNFSLFPNQLKKRTNVYNRLILFDGRHFHSAAPYFGKTIEDSRLFQIFFRFFQFSNY